MTKVPGEITVTGSFLGNEVEFAVWMALCGLDGTVLKPNLAIVSCHSGRENEVCGILEGNKPGFVKTINQTDIPWAKQ